ncbi:MAG: NifU N-terminal domain-containing protein [Anaerolineales bacterium]|nr:NifU N-terminal domain-containing protein [Anaerolineales bacterium]MCB8951318.1 NifU N-terminal domain-containing protein [Ardenticatenales bacterium]
MSEYIEITTKPTDDPDVMFFYTNLRLDEGEPESYDSLAAMEEGSPVAQALALVAGIAQLYIDGQELTITREPGVEWYFIAADVSAILKDFFL